tara:strand:- start:10050 stop:10838 length:789 start_codon:yes stop_codon:yes gene_type:complete
MELKDFDIVIVNSSGGKDSLASLWQIVQMALEQCYPLDQVVVSHQDLGKVEWKGTKELVKRQSDHWGLKTYYSKRRDKDGYEEDLLEYAVRRGKWPSSQQRWCTSDFKRGPGARVVTSLTKDMGECKVLYVFGFRAEESPARSKKEVIKLNKQLTTKKRTVIDYLPIHDWSSKKVWDVIKSNNLEYHKAYDLGMPRLSCCFCIFSPFNALLIAGKENPELLAEYVAVEEQIGHTFKNGESIKSVQEALEAGVEPEVVEDWVM